jgi:hypothetical protein
MSSNRYARIAFVIAGISLLSTVGKAQPGFNAGCTKPFFPSPAPKTLAPIDAQCPLGGEANQKAPETAQNKAKNNFCAVAPADPSITVAKMVAMQADVESNTAINFGKSGPTTDRTPLKAMGEGQQRVLQGYVFIARQEGKEAVNCGPTFPDKTETMDHDIHISIVGDISQVHGNECESVVAEMSPHHRPDSWNPANLQAVAFQHLPVRITGQLFFDSSHSPCVDGKSQAGDPHRASLWELHPIYKFEVCPTSDCSGGGWQTLDAWIQKSPAKNPAKSPAVKKKP